MIQYDPMRIVPIESNCTNPMRIQSNPIANRIQCNLNPFFSFGSCYDDVAHTNIALSQLHSFLIHCILSFIRTCHIAVTSSVALFICGSCVHARMKHEGMKKPCLLGRVAMWLIDSNVVASYISLH